MKKFLGNKQRAPEIVVDSMSSAQMAGLRYVSDSSPGIIRKSSGKGFIYIGADGKRIRAADSLGRIKSLVIPPGWSDVWICPSPQGHIQAIGRDDRGRKQYRYHANWNQTRDETKYERMIAFGKSLPRIRRQTQKHLKLPDLPRQKVLAAVIRLLEKTLIRVGNDEYAKNNESFGLTTLRDRHVDVSGAGVQFKFRGKSGIEHAIDIEDRRIAGIVQKCQDLPGYELFQYLDDAGEQRDVTSGDVNQYLREIAGQEFTAKDFRTWAGTMLAAMALREFEAFDSEAQGKQNVLKAIESVAQKLGNTKAVCRKCYIHPAVIDSYLDGTLAQTLKQRAEQKMRQSLSSLSPEEAAIMALLRQRLAHQTTRRKSA